MHLLDALNQHADARSDAPAFREVGGDGSAAATLTYRQYAEGVAATSHHLAEAFEADATVLIQLTNQAAYPVAYLAALAAGLRVFPLHPALTDYEVSQAAANSSATGIITQREAPAGLIRITPYEIKQWLQDASHPRTRPSREPGSMLLQSSGTTGLPKIVHRSAGSIDAVARNVAEAVELSATDNIIAAIPLCHSYGIENGLVAPLLAGACVHACPGFDPHTISAIWSDLQNVVVPAVPIMIDLLATAEGLAPPGQRLKQMYSAGAILPDAVTRRFTDRFEHQVGQLYGATEIGSVTFGKSGSEPLPAGCVGKPMRDVSIKIFSTDEHEEPKLLSIGCTGQVAVSAPSMLDRYITHADLPLIDGHYLSGDLGFLDDRGRLTITGRISALIEVGGMKVNATEVENTLTEHEAVAECVVVPVRVSDTLARLTAFIVPSDPANEPTAAALRQFAKSRLAAYKVPRAFNIVEQLPRTSLGKVQRRSLMEAKS